MKTRRTFVLLALIGILVLNGFVFAHHSVAGYGNEDKTLKGTVVEYKWRNPHVFIVWEVKDQAGKSVRWIGELASVTSMISVGMTKDSLKPGDEITVIGTTAKAGTPESLIKIIAKADGTRYILDRAAVGKLP